MVQTPQQVATQHPVVCVHTRLTDEVESWKIQRTLQLVREMGAPTIVEFFPWAYVETARGQYDWNHPDRIIGLAQQQGLRIIARLGLVPGWARDQSPAALTSLNSLTPANYPAFAAFVAAFAARYRAVVRMIIPWNEPNLSFEWGYRSVSAAEYTDFMRQVYTAVKAANPAMMVLGGALAPTLEQVGSTNAISDLAFLEGIYASGGAPYFDALAVHSYDLTRTAPTAPPSADKINFRRVELLRQIMAAHGDQNKPVFITEMGWNDHPRWAYAVHPGERVSFTIEAMRFAEANWPWARSVCVWNFRMPSLVQSYPDYWAIVTPDFQKRALYDALQRFALNP
jgi:hypothetical protein